MNKFVLIDTGFWCALYESNDQYHEAAIVMADLLDDQILLIPWPTMYEFVNTKLIRRQRINDRLIAFKNQLSKPNVQLLDDSPYRDNALDEVFSTARFSLVDSVIRNILADIDTRIDYLLTFNPSDFSDLCYRRGTEIIPGP